MGIKGYYPSEDLEYALANDDARRQSPNRKFRTNQYDDHVGNYIGAKKPKKRKKRKKLGYADKHSKNHPVRY